MGKAQSNVRMRKRVTEGEVGTGKNDRHLILIDIVFHLSNLYIFGS